MLTIAIDGASRRNGKPDCVAAGGVFICSPDHSVENNRATTIRAAERASTNQRGEMLALIEALKYLTQCPEDACIITDSEYLFNAMTKEWHSRWAANGWRTADGSPVKNRDLWEHVNSLVDTILGDVYFYHIKGHLIPFGKATASNLLAHDPTGYNLYLEALEKFDTLAPTKETVFAYAQECSVKNNGFALAPETFRNFVALNVVADAVATERVEEADREI